MTGRLSAARFAAPLLLAGIISGVMAQTPTPQQKPASTPPPTIPQVKPTPPPNSKTISGITFDLDVFGKGTGGDGKTYVSVRSAADALGWPVEAQKGKITLNNKPLARDPSGPLPDGSWVMPVRLLTDYGATVDYQPGLGAIVTAGGKSIVVKQGQKRVVVDLTKQHMTAYQGGAIIMTSGISSGRDGHRTPIGTFHATEYKDRDHKSRLYDEAPMPWAVQIVGNIFFHGYEAVERRPESHGCIRMPMDGRNPARFLFYWITPGTPVEIVGHPKEG